MPQSLSNILLHLVFTTKNREPLILPELEPELHACIAAIHKNMACPVLKIGGTDNHLHILCRLERVVTASKLLEEVKKSSSKWIKSKDDRQAGLGLAGRKRRVLHRHVKCGCPGEIYRAAKNPPQTGEF